MILQIYAIKDKAVDAFLQPFFSPSAGSALRSLGTVVNDTNHEFHKHAADYSLYRVGDFDDATGILIPADPVRLLGLSELLTKQRELSPQ